MSTPFGFLLTIAGTGLYFVSPEVRRIRKGGRISQGPKKVSLRSLITHSPARLESRKRSGTSGLEPGRFSPNVGRTLVVKTWCQTATKSLEERVATSGSRRAPCNKSVTGNFLPGSHDYILTEVSAGSLSLESEWQILDLNRRGDLNWRGARL